jgi:ribosomal protein S18 acetylase RimI-like enzyme
MMMTFDERRARVERLLDLHAPVDALYAYYALFHDADRTQIYLHEDARGAVDGFVAVCRTGQRLFVPTVVLRTLDTRVAVDLLREALVPGRPYAVVTTSDLRDVVGQVLDIERAEIHHLYRLDLARFRTLLNVLVVRESAPTGAPRFVIRSQGQVMAQAGLNWQSPYFAELFVHTEPAARGRGWGRAVATACTTWVLRAGKQPLYVVDSENDAGIGLARAIGYVDTGVREFAAEGVCCVE